MYSSPGSQESWKILLMHSNLFVVSFKCHDFGNWNLCFLKGQVLRYAEYHILNRD